MAIFKEAFRLGVYLAPGDGEKLFAYPVQNLSAEFRATLETNKSVLLEYLRARVVPARLHLAKQVLAGEFVGAAPAVHWDVYLQLFGLRNSHPACRRALALLRGEFSNHTTKG